jgi:cytochrome P450
MKGRARDRRVYLAGHPFLFGLMAATRRWPALRIGGTVLVHGRDAYVAALTRVPLDRTADGTTGGAADRLGGADAFFDQQGEAHRRNRRSTAEALGAAGVARLRPVWTEILTRRLAPLALGAEVDLVPLAAELSGSTAAALLGLPVNGRELAGAAREAGATAVREHLPGLFRGRSRRAASAAAQRLTALVAPGGGEAGRAAMLAVAAINTSMAALPRAVAWCADDNLWSYARSHPRSLADELLRVTAPTPLLPRVAAAASTLPTGCPRHEGTDFGVREGDRLLLVARHAVGAHRDDPDPAEPAAALVTQLVFGIGPHACPGARLARAQLVDLLVALAPYRPVVVRSRVDRRAALPGWGSLVVRASAVPQANAEAFNPAAQTAGRSNPSTRSPDLVDQTVRPAIPATPAADRVRPATGIANFVDPARRIADPAGRTVDAGA